MIGPPALAHLKTLPPTEVPSHLRDVLTGAPLEPGAIITPAYETVYRAAPKYLDTDADREVAPPLRLNDSTPQPMGRPLSWQFVRYLDAALTTSPDASPTSIKRDLVQMVEMDEDWWTLPRNRERVHADLCEVLPGADVNVIIKTLTSIAWEIQPPDVAAAEAGVTLNTVGEWISLTRYVARRPRGRSARRWLKWRIRRVSIRVPKAA